MWRSMSRQAEAERDRRARVINADGEFQASARLADAARVMADTPGALQLRLLQTVSDVVGDQNSTLVMPLPMELLRFFDQNTHTSADQPRRAAAAEPVSEKPGPAKPLPVAAEAGKPQLDAPADRPAVGETTASDTDGVAR